MFTLHFTRLGLIFLLSAALLSTTQAAERFTVLANGQEVKDNQTQLIWRRCAEGMSWSGGTCSGSATQLTHEAALQQATRQAASTGVAWRLPNVKELSRLADKSRQNPAIDSAAFPNTPSQAFWSSSPYVGDSNYAWYVNFGSGNVSSGGRGVAFPVRLVRASQ